MFLDESEGEEGEGGRASDAYLEKLEQFNRKNEFRMKKKGEDEVYDLCE